MRYRVFTWMAVVGLGLELIGSAACFGAPAGPSRIREKIAETFVHVVGLKDTPTWKLKALENTIELNLKNFHRISLSPSADPILKECPKPTASCLIRAARDQGVDAVILGTLGERNLTLKSYEAATGLLVESETIAFSDRLNLAEFRHLSFHLLQPFVRNGGLLEQQSISELNEPESPANSIATIARDLLGGGLWAASLGFLLWILFSGFIGLDRITIHNIDPALAVILKVAGARLLFLALVSSPFVLVALSLTRFIGSRPVWEVVIPCSLMLGAVATKTFITKLHEPPGSKIAPPVRIDVNDGGVWAKHSWPVRALLAVLCLAAVTLTARESLIYHGTYVKRMDEIKVKVIEHEKLMQRKNPYGGN